MPTEVITAVTGVGCSIVASVVTFFLTKRKYNVEVDSQVITNMNSAFSAYKEMTNETIKVLNEKVESLQRENESLRSQLSLIQTQMVNMLMGKEIGMFNKDDKKE